MYEEFKQLNLPQIDREILAFWEREGIFEKSIEERDPENTFVFYEGPPSANGKPGIHHVIARSIKDIFCRYQTLKGKRVERKGGWDTHGLPIELSVEKELGITKEDIGKSISVDEYNQKCRETVMRYKDMWDDLTRKMGYWVDLNDPYITYKNEYIESVWYLLKQLYDKGLLYKGYTIQPYSPAAGTGLSSHELNMPGAYREVTDTTVVAMFKVEQDTASAFLWDLEMHATDEEAAPSSPTAEEDVRILAWTTTPWTLPSNTALTVGPRIHYVKVQTINPYTDQPVSVVLAADLVGKWFGGKKQPKVLAVSEPFPGDRLVDVRYHRLLQGPDVEGGDAFRVIPGDFVTTEDGTGIVHTAPSFGADDMRVGKAHGIGALTLVDKTGRFVSELPEFGGRFVKNYEDSTDYVDVNVDISVKLKLDGYAFNVAKYNHNYPHCWRTDKPVLYYPLDSWFVRASSMRERMYELNQTINWKPASTGEGRFGKWLENLQDWNLSRSRYWGIPLPIWRTEDGTFEKCIGSIDELRTEVAHANEVLGLKQEVPSDLHRPYIDEVILATKNGDRMQRELDLIDVWFDSGSMPYAQWHYPFENEEKFKRNFPADFIAEGVDQTRGWFYTLHAIATMVYDSVAFRNVVSNGLVLDKNGHKMSKRLGNAVDPFQTLAKYGADATRWYMISNSDPWDNLKFDLQGLEEVRRRFFGTLYNTYNFFALYANIDQFEMNEQDVLPIQERPEIDRWIISKLYSLVKAVDNDYANYEPTQAARRITSFVDEHLSNWYVRLSRRRFWRGEMNDDKRSAYETLFQCLMMTGQLMSPIAPFFSEWLYKNLSDGIREQAKANNTPLQHDSVHLTYLTEVDEHLIDLELEQRMDYAQRISSLVLSLRKREKIRVRQPLQKILLPVLDPSFQKQVEEVRELIQAEVNIKEIEYLTEEGFLKKGIKPNYKTLGKRLGKHMKAAAAAIAGIDQKDIAEIERTGSYTLEVDGTTYELGLEDFEIVTEDIPGWKVASDGNLTVALDVTITDALAAEGMARELVNRIQNIRKDSDYNVTDRIVVRLEDKPLIREAVDQNGDYIKSEVLADTLELATELAEGEVLDLPGEISAAITVERV